jgi:excisionase family DNA binding protein
VKPRDSRERLTLSVEEAAEVLGIGRTLAYEAVRRGDIPTVRIGRRHLVPREALDQLLGSVTTNGERSRAESAVDPQQPKASSTGMCSTRLNPSEAA